eukprot:423741-Pyramimonas_sp.AAC.1
MQADARESEAMQSTAKHCNAVQSYAKLAVRTGVGATGWGVQQVGGDGQERCRRAKGRVFCLDKGAAIDGETGRTNGRIQSLEDKYYI